MNDVAGRCGMGISMKNRSVAQIILINFFKTIGIILLLLGVGVLSYYLTMLFLKQTARTERSTQYEHVVDINTGNESSNLIYSYNEKNGKVEAMVLELFDSNTKNMTYVTIPADTQITISASKYKELLQTAGKLPQVIKMSDLYKYFSGDVKYEYGIMILQEELKADIGYFTAMKAADFNQYFEKEKAKKLIYRPAKKLLDAASQCKDEEDMNDFIDEKWDTLISNITLSQKQHYAKDLVHVERSLIRTYRIRGSKGSEAFKIDKEKSSDFINGIWEKRAYKVPQVKETASASLAAGAAKKTVFIYNGSKITGLAAKYQQKMQEAGYTVKGVGNAAGDVRTTTVIYVQKKNDGTAFQKFFNDARIETTSDLSSGADVEIVLGTKDSL